MGNVAGLYSKLDYERQQFALAHHQDPPDVDGIIYNCLNFIITAQSLYDWTVATLRAREGAAFAASRFKTIVADPLPHHGLCRDIANTIKYHDFRDGLWLEVV